MFRFVSWKKHKVEIALGIFTVGILWYLHKRHAFYGEMVGMPMGMGGMGMMMDDTITGMPGVDALLKAKMLTAPVMNDKFFADCINGGVDVSECAEAFGGGNKATGGVVDTLNFENCLNEGMIASDCLKRSTRGMGRAAVMKMM